MINLLRLADPVVGADQNAWIGETVACLASEDRDIVEDLLARRIAAELAQWRLDHATLWQRVRIRLQYFHKQSSCVIATS